MSSLQELSDRTNEAKESIPDKLNFLEKSLTINFLFFAVTLKLSSCIIIDDIQRTPIGVNINRHPELKIYLNHLLKNHAQDL